MRRVEFIDSRVRRRGRPRRTWEQQLGLDLKAFNLNETMIANRLLLPGGLARTQSTF
ncbi:hypothetical protein OROHE_017318 [Orobanche hederae]